MEARKHGMGAGNVTEDGKGKGKRKGKGRGNGTGIVEQTAGGDVISRAIESQLQKEMSETDLYMKG